MQKQRLSFSALLLSLTISGWAQVEKVAMRTTGISCGVCAGLSEYHFRRVPGVDKVTISLSKETIMLSYKPGAAFDPAGIRKILQMWQVGVVQFQINARGRFQERAGKQFFIAGKDKFALSAPVKSPEVQSGSVLFIKAILDDHPSPMEIKVLNFKPFAQ